MPIGRRDVPYLLIARCPLCTLQQAALPQPERARDETSSPAAYKR